MDDRNWNWSRTIEGVVDETIEATVVNRWLVIVGVAAAFHALPVIHNWGLPPFDSDSALFSNMGWYMTQGGVPYRDLWDVKPPLIYFVAAGLALVSVGDMQVLYLLGVGVTTAASILSLLALGMLVWDITEDRYASLGAGLFPLILPGFYQIPLGGLRPKYIALFLGVLALLAVNRERPLLAGMFAALAAAGWQWAAIYPLLVVGVAYQRSLRNATRVVVGGLLVAVLVILPFVLWGALEPLIAEVVLTPLIVGSQEGTLVGNVLLAILLVGYGSFALPIGYCGAAKAFRMDIRSYWWIATGAAWFSFQLLLFDFDWRDDLLHLMVFLGLGAGILIASPPELRRYITPRWSIGTTRRSLLAVIAIGVAVGPFWAGGVELLLGLADFGTLEHAIPYKDTVHRTFLHDQVTSPPSRYGLPDVQDVYWAKEKPPVCHFRLSIMERRLMEVIGVTYDTYPCGDIQRYLEHI